MKDWKDKKVKIILSGEGGQGIQTIAKSLVATAVEQGLNASYLPSFGVEQRGTPSIAYVIISGQKINYPRFEDADIVMVLAGRATERVSRFITPNTDILFDSSVIKANSFTRMAVHKMALPATRLSKEKFNPRSYNVLMYGVLINMLGLDKDASWNSLNNQLKDKFKTKKIEADNKDAYIYGFEAVLERKRFSRAEYETKKSINYYKSKDKKGSINPTRCKGCGLCIEKCPTKALSFGEDLGVFATPVPVVDLDKCIACGMCHQICPDGAIIIDKINES